MEIAKDFAFLTLATKEARDTLLEFDIIFNFEKIKRSVGRDKDSKNPSELCVSTMLVANKLP